LVPNVGGKPGIFHVTIAFGVDDVPCANTVGLLQVKVCVNIVADTFGNVVFDNTTTGKGAWQPLIGSYVIAVHVPTEPVVTHCEPLKLIVGIGAVKVLPGGKNAYCTGPLVLLPDAHSVVVLNGDAQPIVKLVLLVTFIVGKADKDITVNVLTVKQPFTLF